MRADILVVAVTIILFFPEASAKAKGAISPDALGGCKFSKFSLEFDGDAAKQTTCLLKKVRRQGSGADVQVVPDWLRAHVGKPIDISDRRLSQYLAQQGVEATSVGGPLARGSAKHVRYFVIHDTSAPEIPESDGFPTNLDEPGYMGNNLTRTWANSKVGKKVNLIVARDGQSHTYHPWGSTRPEAATKLESSTRVPEARPLFVHVENVQPRLKPPNKWAWIAPSPGLSPQQEERLALLYITASYQAGKWLTPAYHFNIDQGLPDGHDDPQHMNLLSWAGRVKAIHNLVKE